MVLQERHLWAGGLASVGRRPVAWEPLSGSSGRSRTRGNSIPHRPGSRSPVGFLELDKNGPRPFLVTSTPLVWLAGRSSWERRCRSVHSPVPSPPLLPVSRLPWENSYNWPVLLAFPRSQRCRDGSEATSYRRMATRCRTTSLSAKGRDWGGLGVGGGDGTQS